jgi:hypothetical protein
LIKPKQSGTQRNLLIQNLSSCTTKSMTRYKPVTAASSVAQ